MKFPRSLNLNPSLANFVFIASVLITLVFNFPFISNVYHAVSPTTVGQWIFFLSVPLLLTFFNIIALSLLGAILLPRLTVAVTLLVSSLLLYGTVAYGVIFDKSMIQNVMETNSGEAFAYLNSTLLLFFFLLGLVPVVAVFNQLSLQVRHVQTK